MTTFITKSISINGTEYKIACSEDDERRLEYLAEQLNKRIAIIATTSHSKLDDKTLLLFAALELENLLLDNMNNNSANEEESSPQKEKLIDSVTYAIENFVEHVENMD